MSIKASSILFGKSTSEDLKFLDEGTFLSVFEGVPKFEISIDDINCNIIDLLALKTDIFSSKGEARRMLSSNGVSINKTKIGESYKIEKADLLNGKYVLVQKGKKNYFLITVL